MLLSAAGVFAQQEAIFSQFFYQKTYSNPGAAGSNGYPCLTAFHRQQWVGLEGAPSTQTLSFNSPAFADRVGVGLTLANDRIGFFNSTFANVAYAYRIAFGNGKLGIGMHASYLHRRVDWDKAETISGRPDPLVGDENFSSGFNVGAGAHFENERFFAGISAPYFLDRGGAAAGDFSGTTPHIFFMTGVLLDLSSKVKMRPALAARVVKNAPPGVDVHLSFGLLDEARLWLGSTLRMSRSGGPANGDALVAMAQYQIGQRLRAGFAYDASLNELRRENQGTFELMIEYSLVRSGVAVRNPRFF
jgi:type IX secretion system PorP/SprF family membrane protein